MTVEDSEFIAIIVCDTQIESIRKFGDFGDQGITLLKAGGLDQYPFRKYDVIEKQEFPSLQELSHCKGMYLTGSRADSFADIPWIKQLIVFMKVCLTDFDFPIVAACFGHQIIGLSLGLEATRNQKGWEMGITQISLNPHAGVEFLASKESSKSFHIMEMHQDIVIVPSGSSLPEGYHILGSSEKCEVQGIYKKGKLLTFQGHPEFSTECGNILIDGRLEQGCINKEECVKLKSTNAERANDGLSLGKCMAEMIKEKL